MNLQKDCEFLLNQIADFGHISFGIMLKNIAFNSINYLATLQNQLFLLWLNTLTINKCREFF